MLRNNYFRFTKWLPTRMEDGDYEVLDDDLSGWIAHFYRLGIKTKKVVREDGKIALFREGVDRFQEQEDK